MEYKLFCFIVFGIQAFICIFNFILAWGRYRFPRAIVDVLAGISWGLTGAYWLWQGLSF